MRKIGRGKTFSLVYLLLLGLSAGYILLDTFVIPRRYAVISVASVNTAETEDSQLGQAEDQAQTADSTAQSSASFYQDARFKIEISQYREDDSDIYVADIVLSDASYLKTALADNTFGKNITAATSEIAQANNAVLAINGDYYSARSGLVLRNGVLYRSAGSDSSQTDLLIQTDGTWLLKAETDISDQWLSAQQIQQGLSFGPALLSDGQIEVGVNTEVNQAKGQLNPRSAVGQISDLHYVMVVVDGRSSTSQGVSLYQLAAFMQQLQVQTAYNLDGGGSATLYFNGQVINHPTSDGRVFKERKVSDILYVG
ncbi:phosphodiester glycosidase family protein [Oscillospiraceae bacterium HV4-5-C5C]|nr:phosphodiester glycosidase family protein [Oscillospiraceae bacterium HV4-5-C5C]